MNFHKPAPQYLYFLFRTKLYHYRSNYISKSDEMQETYNHANKGLNQYQPNNNILLESKELRMLRILLTTNMLPQEKC